MSENTTHPLGHFHAAIKAVVDTNRQWVACVVTRDAHPAPRGPTDEDRAALQSISESGLFTLERSKGMYAGIERLRDTLSQ